MLDLFFLCQGVNKNKIKENPDKASVSRSNDTENYLPCWEGWFVEANEAVETAFDITAGSDDDASVKEQDKDTDTTLFPVVWVLYFLFPHCFSLAQFVSDCTRLLSVNRNHMVGVMMAEYWK